jgi:glycosyltransferase involved in cell wall biosynthesis
VSGDVRAERLRFHYWPPGPSSYYLGQLYRDLEEAGHLARPATPLGLVRAAIGRARRRVAGGPDVADIVHLHWAEGIGASRYHAVGLVRLLRFHLLFTITRLLGIPRIATIHNLRAHDHLGSWLDATSTRYVYRHVDGWIALTPGGRDRAREAFPALRGKPSLLSGIWVEERVPASSPGIPELPGEGYLLHFGRIRPYKGTAELIACYRALDGSRPPLVIAGAPLLVGDVREALDTARRTDGVVLIDRYLSDGEAARLYRGAMLGVYPFREVETSASVVRAVANGVRVLAPRIGGVPDIAALVGPEWLSMYDGVLTPDVLRRAIAWASGPTPSSPPNLVGPTEGTEALVSFARGIAARRRGDADTTPAG